MMKIAGLILCFLITAPPARAENIFSIAQNERGNQLYEKGQVAKAKKAYESAIKSAPKSPEIAFNLGNAYYKEQAFGESLKRYANATQTVKEPLFRSRAFYNFGNALHRAGKTDKAIEAYKQALRLNPKDLDAKYNLELLNNKKKEDNKKKPDEKKDQDKKDPNQKDQNQQGGGGSGDQKDQQGEKGQQDQKGEQGEGGDAEKEQQDKGEQQSKGEQGQQEKKQGSEQSPEGDSKGDSEPEEAKEQEGQQGQDQSPDQGKGDEERQAQEQAVQEKDSAQQSQGSEPEPAKTDAQKRAEQILEALQGQEQQIFRMQNNGERRRGRAQQVMEKDW